MSIGNPDSEQFERFYNGYYRKTLAFVLRRISARCDAEDLVGDAFLYCYDHFSEYDESRASLGTWLYVIVSSKIKKYYRDMKILCDLETLDKAPRESESYLDRAAELTEIRNVLASALQTLTKNQRKIVILRYFQYQSTAETAKKMGMSEGNVRAQLSRALTKIKQYCEKTGIGKE